jgi:hypothetical protein
MKFSSALTSLILIIPLFTGEALAAAAFGRGKGGNKGGANQGKSGASKSTSSAIISASSASSTSVAAAATSAAATGAAANNGTAAASNSTVLANAGAGANNTGSNANNNGNPQTSLTLDPKVIATGFEQNGQETPAAGQVASLTSNNNFINFCLTVPNLPLTNGQQVKTGSCNPAPMGIIAATTNMPSSKFTVPVNGQNFGANTPFTITMAVNHLVTGNFVNADANYYAAPQQISGDGDIIGHTHFTVQDVGSFTSTAPLDPNVFAFFKGVNTAAVNGVVSETVTAGLPAGTYRVCSINTDANHTPCLVAVAQHGFIDDCVYFTTGGSGASPFSGASNATSAGGAATASNSTAAGNAASSAPPAASSAVAVKGASSAPPAASSAAAVKGASSAPPAASSAAAAKGAGQAGNGNKGQAGNGGRKAGGRRVRLGRQSRLGRDY